MAFALSSSTCSGVFGSLVASAVLSLAGISGDVEGVVVVLVLATISPSGAAGVWLVVHLAVSVVAGWQLFRSVLLLLLMPPAHSDQSPYCQFGVQVAGGELGPPVPFPVSFPVPLAVGVIHWPEEHTCSVPHAVSLQLVVQR